MVPYLLPPPRGHSLDTWPLLDGLNVLRSGWARQQHRGCLADSRTESKLGCSFRFLELTVKAVAKEADRRHRQWLRSKRLTATQLAGLTAASSAVGAGEAKRQTPCSTLCSERSRALCDRLLRGQQVGDDCAMTKARVDLESPFATTWRAQGKQPRRLA